jgi:DNA-binding MarR family transcriptional regulator
MNKRSVPEMACACMAARQAARLVTQFYDAELRDHLPVPQFGLLSVIAGRPGCSQALLSRMLDFDKTTLSRNMKLLEQNGLIARADPVAMAASQDRRERGYRLTPQGFKRLNAAKPAWNRAQTRLRSAMTASQWQAMWQTFGNLASAAHQAGDSAT